MSTKSTKTTVGLPLLYWQVADLRKSLPHFLAQVRQWLIEHPLRRRPSLMIADEIRSCLDHRICICCEAPIGLEIQGMSLVFSRSIL